MIWQPDPYQGMRNLPEQAPSPSLHPTNYPTRPVWEARLRRSRHRPHQRRCHHRRDRGPGLVVLAGGDGWERRPAVVSGDDLGA